ncbi:Zinc finger MYM-type protein 1-like [Oopsacas minuta]|uniref:Zinc finger MYM-type protein 1-like n=1 Tax=Oopsacas minuta TaxID=111878 RepID=A0AAV7KJ62_9METZ|nr:Zinc finger MYM-type protein 1-like [Oopsacas minuta]
MSRNDAISKRAKLTGIKRFFKDIPLDEQTNVSDEHNRQPSSISSLSLIPEQPVVYPTLESSTTEIAGSSQSCVPCAVILSLAENDEQDLQLNFNSNDSCCQQSISGSRNSSIAVCVDDTPQHLDSDDPDPLDLPTPGSCYLHGSSSSISVSSMSIANNITSLGKPNQLDISVIPVQLLPSRSLHFQKNWYQEYQWLHYSSGLKNVLCFYCSKASALGLLDLARCQDPAFILNGFDNWKKAHEKFRSHQMSRTHQLAINQISAIKRPAVNVQMNTLKLKEQEISRNSLLKLFTTIRYLLRQGSAIRGHDETSGNYFQLLKLRSEDDPDLGMYLKRTTNFISPRGQEEMMEMFSHCIVREVVSDIQKHGCFAIIVDGTQDVSGREQESICLRHVNSDLHVREDFVGYMKFLLLPVNLLQEWYLMS